MGLTPEDIEARAFASSPQGYDGREVRTFLREVAETVADLQQECQRLRRARPDDGGSRQQALAELDEVRAQVARLLEQARAQSELIRQEAEEAARVRVRTVTEQAEDRLRALRTTEQAFRARIGAAQQELGDALRRLDEQPAATLDPGVREQVVEAALGAATTPDALEAVPLVALTTGPTPDVLEAVPFATLTTAPAPPPPPSPPAPSDAPLGSLPPDLVSAPSLPQAWLPATPAADAGPRPRARFGSGPRPITARTSGEDALATLVAQALQRAVESARPGRGA